MYISKLSNNKYVSRRARASYNSRGSLFFLAGVAVRLVVVVVVGAPAISGGANGGFAWLDRLFTAVAWQKKNLKVLSLLPCMQQIHSRFLFYRIPKATVQSVLGGLASAYIGELVATIFFPSRPLLSDFI